MDFHLPWVMWKTVLSRINIWKILNRKFCINLWLDCHLLLHFPQQHLYRWIVHPVSFVFPWSPFIMTKYVCLHKEREREESRGKEGRGWQPQWASWNSLHHLIPTEEPGFIKSHIYGFHANKDAELLVRASWSHVNNIIKGRIKLTQSFL